MQSFLANLAGAAVVAVISAYVTANVMLRKFRAEKWWERRADAYARIMEALHHMKRCIEIQLRVMLSHETIIEQRQKQLAKRHIEASDEVRRAATLSTFLLSSEASGVLTALIRAFAQAEEKAANNFWVELEEDLAAIDECLSKLPSIARRDLRVR